jgi:hypothetical protein
MGYHLEERGEVAVSSVVRDLIREGKQTGLAGGETFMQSKDNEKYKAYDKHGNNLPC